MNVGTQTVFDSSKTNRQLRDLTFYRHTSTTYVNEHAKNMYIRE